MENRQDISIHSSVQRELGLRRSAAPGILQARQPLQGEPQACLKEVIAIIKPERWVETKTRVQQLCLPAFTQARVLGRGRARGLRYLPRHGASTRTGMRYLPKRMISWIVEERRVEPLVQAIIAANQTGQIGDGKIFIMPIEEAVRIRTGERSAEAVRPHRECDTLWATPQHSVATSEMKSL